MAKRTIVYKRDEYLTHCGCLVREQFVPVPGGVFGAHIELSGSDIKPREHIEKRRRQHERA